MDKKRREKVLAQLRIMQRQMPVSHTQARNRTAIHGKRLVLLVVPLVPYSDAHEHELEHTAVDRKRYGEGLLPDGVESVIPDDVRACCGRSGREGCGRRRRRDGAEDFGGEFLLDSGELGGKCVLGG